MASHGKRMKDQELVAVIKDIGAPMVDRADAAQAFRKRHSLKPFDMAADLDMGLCFTNELLEIARLPKAVKEALKALNIEPWIMIDYRKDFPKASEEEMVAEIIRLRKWIDEAERWNCRRMAEYDGLDDVCKVIEKATVVSCIVATGRWKLDVEVKAALMPALHSALKFLQGRSEMHSDEAELLTDDEHVNHMCRKWFGASIHYKADLTDKSTYARRMRCENLANVIHAVKLIFERMVNWKPNGWLLQSTYAFNDVAALAEVFADRTMEAIAVSF